MFHAITGCDQTSFIAGRGKLAAWVVWRHFPDVIKITFVALHISCHSDIEEHMDVIEKIAVKVYDRTGGSKTVNQAQKELFVKKSRAMDAIPPAKAALKEYLDRTVF